MMASDKVPGENTKGRRAYTTVASGIYLAYVMLGMATIVVSQYSANFQKLWHTNVAGVSTVIAMVGLGRLATILFAGPISDRFGRKPTLLIGLVSMIIFLLGLAFSRSVLMASVFALFLGFTNSFSDAGSYPALSDAFPDNTASMNALNKAAMSLAQFGLPFLVVLLPTARPMLIMMAIVVALNCLLVSRSRFAPQNRPDQKAQSETQAVSHHTQPRMAVDGLALILLGFTISFTFYIFMQYAPNFGATVLHVPAVTAKSLISWYAISSLISVFLTTIIVTRVKLLPLIFTYVVISVAALIAMVTAPTLLVARIASILIGFFAAGGIWQLGLTVLTQYFPQEKGRVTGYYSFSTSLTYFVGPFVSSFIINETAISVIRVFQIDVVVTVIGAVLLLILWQRNRRYHFI
ncbi:MFS transporter [Loigolactobacillus bifermentans]|uniref:MFS family major facilitator transporter n=1 Tax=Loigolactobacillus bifermentans DSM 20003 TaxID=1423726 RepID=A0A0R1GG27_9LACO|nr:MFS transporter [Loigolactobacillus bifermentans]KRK33174.1 MFS family major facilitator transporter [Loigolactobacillus bifermentans DSM 20003]